MSTHIPGPPCLVPPSPGLQTRIVAERAQRDNQPITASIAAAITHRHRETINKGPPHVCGLNDGVIFDQVVKPGLSNAQRARQAAERKPLRGPVRVLVVLVDFPDVAMKDGANERFTDLFFGDSESFTGSDDDSAKNTQIKSVTDYFKSASRGLVSIAGQVVGPLRMPLTLAEYAHGSSGFGDELPNVRTLATNALDALLSSSIIPDFTGFDNDGNGAVDAFIVVHAGTGAEVTGNVGDLWSLKWVLEGKEARTVPGSPKNKTVYGFLTVPEDAQIGVCAHEIGHLVFGWPDLYDTDGSSQGAGDFCLMASGSWGGFPWGSQPVQPSAWCKAQQKWVEVVNQTPTRGIQSSAPAKIELQDVKSSGEVLRLWKDGVVGDEYFLVENRQKRGGDEAIPAGGLLVWHIDDKITSNDNEKHYKVGLLQADGLRELERTTGNAGDAGDVFPGSTTNRTLSQATNPSTKSYRGKSTGVVVENISDSAEVMTFTVRI